MAVIHVKAREKLVRGLIPRRHQGGTYRVAKDHERMDLLRAKLLEEVGEFLAEPVRPGHEAADVLEVMLSILTEGNRQQTRALTLQHLVQVTEDKRAERGGFDVGIVLVA